VIPDCRVLVKSADALGNTPLHVASLYGKSTAVRALLDLGAPTEAVVQQSHRTPLHYAARLGHVECVRALLAKGGADPSARDRNGATALDLCAPDVRFSFYIY
jgi:ankyrin repeat protein